MSESGAEGATTPQVARLSVRQVRSFRDLLAIRVGIDLPRFLFFALALICTSVAGLIAGVQIPLLHLELIGFAPFLTRRWAQIAAILALAVETARVIQDSFGFDQIFVAAYLLWQNLSGFPVAFAIATVALIATPLVLLYVAFRKLPLREIRVPVVYSLSALILIAVPLKLDKDHTRVNLVGSSIGHVYGQLKFSTMLTGHYSVPEPSPAVQPGVLAARIGLAAHSNVWVIVLESGGYPNEQILRDQLFDAFQAPALTTKYIVDIGGTPSVGSTIHGELRQLCDGHLVDGLFGNRNLHCLPNVFDKAGYTTTAVHANKKSTYGRGDWYPKIGFSKVVSSDLPDFPHNDETGRWGTLDDLSTIDWVQTHLLQQRNSFVYTLTISTHLPAILMTGAKPMASCEANHDEQTCIHLANMHLVLTHIAEASQTLTDTEVVIVGDHAPPFISRSSSSAFDRTLVTKITLTPRQHLAGG